MSPNEALPAGAIPDAVVKKRRGIPLVWLVPVVAAAIGAWLWWNAVQETGPTIRIAFATADGLEPGKSKVKYNDIEIGEVGDIKITDDLSGVEVTATLAPWAEPHLLESSRFWVVRPRVGASGISGLGTLMSGVYIAFEPGRNGAPARRFEGLELPPIAPAEAPGLKITLDSDTLGSIAVSTPVYFRQIAVGQVERYRLTDARRIEIDLYIEPEYATLVRKNTLFWNASGVDLSLDATGLKLAIESLDSLVTGGIAFETPEHQPYGDAAEAGSRFLLYERRPSKDDLPTETLPFVVYFFESTRGLSVGAPVEFRGTVLGTVSDVSLQYVLSSGDFRTRVEFEISQGRIQVIGTDAGSMSDEIQRLISLGLRARLGTGNLLTGSLLIDLDLHPETEIALTDTDDPMMQVPSIASTGENLAKTLQQLPEIVADFRDITRALSELAHSSEMRDTLARARGAVEGLEKLFHELGPIAADLRPAVADLGPVVAEIGPTMTRVEARVNSLLAEVESTTATARGLLARADGAVAEVTAATPAVRTRLLSALDELSSSLRAVRVLADYLERHPEALIQGKPGS